ncbi:MAG TPA: hypothetical protein DGR79_03320 [Clostridiales bacterium]|nr:hypothetical protein [Clostridiales bacterium]
MTVLVHLGLVNAVRNIGRSLLAVTALSVAALMMTGSLTLGEGYTAMRAAEYRAFLGGDVLVYPDWTWPTEADIAGVEPGRPRLAVLPEHFGSPLRYFHPDFYSEGYLTAAPETPGYSMFPTARDLASVLETVRAHPEVAGVELYRTLPVLAGSLVTTGAGGKGTEEVSLEGFHLRSCPPNLLGDAGDRFPSELRLVPACEKIPPYFYVAHAGGETILDHMYWETGVFVSAGRPLVRDDGDEPVALINRRAVFSHEEVHSRSILFGAERHQVLRLVVPGIVCRPAGPGEGSEGRLRPFYDFSRPVTVEVRLVGAYDVASRLYQWVHARGVSGYEQLYMEAPEILLNPAAFDDILRAAGLPEGEAPPVGALLVRLRSQAKAEATVEELRRMLPGYSVVSVARETAFANARLLPEPVHHCPPEKRATPLPRTQPFVPADTERLFAFLLFGFAGLVTAGNSALMVLSRRTEFAILKAIGMRGFEIGFVVLVEVVTLAVIGLLVGFTAAEVASLPVILTNKIGTRAVLTAVARDFAVVAAATLGCAVVFALVPISKTLRITVSEAMRGDA